MSQPYPIFGSQDLKDDDGQVIDSLLIETDAPPDPREGIQPIPIPTLPVPVVPNRLLSGNMRFSFGVNAFQTPTQILPADPNRTSIMISVLSLAVAPQADTEYIALADETGKVMTSSAMLLRVGKDPLTLGGYTGALWAAISPTATAAMEITWAAVTK